MSFHPSASRFYETQNNAKNQTSAKDGSVIIIDDEPPTKRQRTLEKLPKENDATLSLPANDLFEYAIGVQLLCTFLISLRTLDMLSGPQAIVIVEGEEIALSKKLLCHYSPYFKIALTGSFVES